MSPTAVDTPVREIMQPLPASVTPQTLTSEALQAMRREGVDFLPIVAPVTERLLGVVRLRALELGCESIGHKPAECLVISHLKPDIEFCFQEETAAEVVGAEPRASVFPNDRREPPAPARPALPVIVVDENKVPVGFLERSRLR